MKSGDPGVKNSMLTPGGEKKRRIHRISEIRKKYSDNKCDGKIMSILKGTDNAKITRKWSKPDKHGHGNGKSAQEPGISSKVNSSRNPYVIPDVKGNDTLVIPCILIGGLNVAGNGRLRSK
ncbi:hypothetical protein Tco_0862085, partial [Tanacetum coccineum]